MKPRLHLTAAILYALAAVLCNGSAFYAHDSSIRVFGFTAGLLCTWQFVAELRLYFFERRKP